MSFFRRRFPKAFKVVGRDPQDYAQEFQEFIDQSINVGEGLPAGFSNQVPATVRAGIAGTVGTASDGWSPPSAITPIETGPPIGLSNSNGEGAGTALMRASALIKRDVRVKKAAADIGTRNALNFSTDFTVTDDAGGDKVDLAVDTSAIGSSSGLLLAIQSLLRHFPRIPEVQAGTNITLAYNALGPVISAAGSSAVDSDQNILATQIFGSV